MPFKSVYIYGGGKAENANDKACGGKQIHMEEDSKTINPKFRKGKIFGNETYFADVEKRMRRAVNGKDIPKYARDYKALLNTYIYWKAYDAMNATFMARNFNAMYMSEENFSKTVYDFTEELSIGETTLLRHRRLYAKTFEYFASLHDGFDFGT